MQQKFVYLIVWGDYYDRNRKFTYNDRFTQYVFDTEEKAKKYVFNCLINSKEYLEDISEIPDAYSGIEMGKCYDIVNDKLVYDYITIKQYYLR